MQERSTKMRLSIFLVLAALMAVFLVACGGNNASSDNSKESSDNSATQESNEDATAKDTKDGMIGIAVPGADHGWTAGVAYYAEQRAKELGLEEGTGYRILTSSDANGQANDIDELIQAKCTSIVLLPHSDEVSVSAQKILDAGINLIVFDRKVDVDYTAYIAGDNPGMGEDAADYIGKALNGEGTVAVMSVPAGGSVSTERVGGFKDVMQKSYPNIKLVDVTADAFTQEAGLKMASDMLTANSQVDAVFSIDDEDSLGVLQAIQEASRTDVKLISGGGGMQAWYEKIAGDNGDLNLFTETYSPSMIGDAIAIAQKIQKGETVEKDTIIPPTNVNAENVQEFIDPNSPY